MGAYDQGRTAWARSRRSSVRFVGDRQLVIPGPQHGTQRSAGGGASPCTAPTAGANIRRVGGMPPLPSTDVRALVEDADGQRRDDPRQHPELVLPDFSKPDPLVTFTLIGRRVRLRDEMEAALLQEGGRRLLPAPGAVGRDAQDLAAVLRAAEHRLVGAALSRRTTCSARPGRSATAATRSTTTCRRRR